MADAKFTLWSNKNITVGSKPKDVAVEGTIAYVCQHENPGYLVLFDISDASSPTQLGNISINNGPNVIIVKNKIAYIGTNTGRLYIINCNNPNNPSLISNKVINSNKQKFDLDVKDNYAYLADTEGNGFQIVDCSDLSNPSVVYTDGYNSGGVEVEGDYAYTTRYFGPSSLRIYNISDPENPTLTKAFNMGDMITNVSVKGNIVFVGEYTNKKLYIVDVSDVNNPVIKATINTKGSLSNEGSSFASFDGDILYVFSASSNASVTLYDISDVENPVEISSYDSFSNINGGFVVADKGGGTIYIPNRGEHKLALLQVQIFYPYVKPEVPEYRNLSGNWNKGYATAGQGIVPTGTVGSDGGQTFIEEAQYEGGNPVYVGGKTRVISKSFQRTIGGVVNSWNHKGNDLNHIPGK